MGSSLCDGELRLRQLRIIRSQTLHQFQRGFGVAGLAHQCRQMQKRIGWIARKDDFQKRFGLGQFALVQQQRCQRLLGAFRSLVGFRPKTGRLQRTVLVAGEHRDLGSAPCYPRIPGLLRKVQISRFGDADRAALSGHLGHQKFEKQLRRQGLVRQIGLALFARRDLLGFRGLGLLRSRFRRGRVSLHCVLPACSSQQ
jgi:hypothetical protein